MAVTKVPVATLAQNWANNMGAATARMQAGVQAVTTPPGQAAAAQQAAYVAGVQANANIWAQKVAAVSLSEWQQAYITKGLQRVGPGAQAAQTKFATTLGKIIQAESQIVAGLPARGGLSQNISRATAFMTQMAAQKGNFS